MMAIAKPKVESTPTTTRLRVAGTGLLIVAALMFVGSFIATAKTPPGYDMRECVGSGPCDTGNGVENRQRVFFLWIGATLIVLIGGVALRSVWNRSDT
jgi:high-affinity Fe2+/Pb2+ permease